MNRPPDGSSSDRPPPFAPEPSHPHFVVDERPHGWKRVAKTIAAIVLLAATFVLAGVAAIALHLGTPPARRLAAFAVNEVLEGTFRGKIKVLRVDRLEADGVDGAAVTLTGPDGRPLALVEGVRARIALVPLIASILFGGDMKVNVTELSIDHVDVLLDETQDGSLTIAQAFQPAKEEPPPPPTKSGGLALSLSRIALKHAWVHGGMSAIPVVDAELDDLAGTFAMTPDRRSVDLRSLHVTTRGMPSRADLGVSIDGHLVLPSNVGEMRASVGLRGTVGGIDLIAHGGIDRKKIDGTVDVPAVAPTQLEHFLGSSPIHQVASLHAEAHGTLPRVEPTLHLTLGEGTVDLKGDVTIPSDGQPDTLATIAIAARDLDARAASVTAPPSKLALDLSASGRLGANGAYDGRYDLHVLPGTVGARSTPDARIGGTFAPTSIRGAGHVAEPGMPCQLRFDVNPTAKGGPDIAFDASVGARDLSTVPVLEGAVRGRGFVHAEGNVALGAKRIALRLQSTLEKIDAGSVAVDGASIRAAVSGSFDAPSGSMTVAGAGLRAARYAYPTFEVTAHGESGRVDVVADLRGGSNAAVTAKGTVVTGKSVSARDVVVTLAKDKDAITARVASARSDSGSLDVEGIRLEGAGEPLDGELHLRPGSVRTRVSAPGVDVPTLLRIAGIKGDLRAGRVGLDVDLEASKHGTKGHANATVRRVTYGEQVRGLDGELATTFDGQSATVHLDARDAEKDALTIDTENGRLAAGALDPRAWLGATGRVHLTTNVDLHGVHKNARGTLPFDDLRGWLTARLDVQRDRASERPAIVLAGSTRGLVFTTEPKTVPAGDRTVIAVGKSFHSQGLDARVNAHFDGETGKTDLDFLLGDEEGHLLEANAATTLPMKALLEGSDPRAALVVTPLRAHVEMPVRSVAAVPALLASLPMRGQLGFTLDAEGTAEEPHLQALIHARDITDAADPTPVPISLETAAIYDGKALRAKLVASHQGAQVMDVVADVALRARDALAGLPRWEANAEAHFVKFPIGAVTGFVDENAIDANLDGSIVLRDLHKAGHLDVALDLSSIAINGARFGDTKATLKVEEGSLLADAKMAQKDGYADVHVTGAMGWGDAVTPTVDPKAPLDVALRAKNFRIAMFAPFVRSVVSELDGRLNADTKLHVMPGMKDGTMDGAVVLSRGLFETPAVGEELHNLCARIFMKPWGVWNVAEISADGTSGHFTANAVAHVNGLSFRSGEAHLKIAEKDKLPLAMQGMELGTVWGQIDAKGAASSDGKKIDVDVNIPNLHIGLPQSIAHGVQSTTPDPTIKVGSIEPGGVVAILPVDGSLPPPAPPEPAPKPTSAPSATLHITTHLGPDLEIRRDTTVRAYVTEGPTIDIGKETTISGRIAIPRGYIELQGKRLQIDKGQLTFTGQPVDNPVVVATASYDSPDGTRVIADFIGPVKTGKLTLHSEPQLSQNEILALLLFGTSDGTFGQSAPPGQQGNDVTQAASLAGGVVTEGLNKAISGVSGIEVQTKVDTQETGDPRPEVEVALSRDVSATLVYNLGVPPPGQNPDDTLLVVDWRFHKNYATEATVGDKGTSILDLTWKYRY